VTEPQISDLPPEDPCGFPKWRSAHLPGNLDVPPAIIRRLVARGIDTMGELADAIAESPDTVDVDVQAAWRAWWSEIEAAESETP